MSSVLKRLTLRWLRPCRNEDGAAALEWAVLASAIIAVAAFSITNLGNTILGLFKRVADLIGALF